MRGANPPKTNRARRLRRTSTDAEMKLWSRLRSGRLAGVKFVRQEPIGSYVVDFVCREQRLIVEVDGGQHAESRTDTKRDAFLRANGYRVLRFWNTDVLQNTEGVLELIARALDEAPPLHPVLASGLDRPLPASLRHSQISRACLRPPPCPRNR